MVEINLISWREQKKKYETVLLRKMIATILTVLVVIGVVVNLVLKNRIVVLQNAIQELSEQQERYDALRKEAESSESTTNAIITNRQATQRLFIELAKVPTMDVCFTEIARSNGVILFLGYTRSAADLTRFLVNWNGANLFSEIKIESLAKQKDSHMMRFRFVATEKQIVRPGRDVI